MSLHSGEFLEFCFCPLCFPDISVWKFLLFFTFRPGLVLQLSFYFSLLLYISVFIFFLLWRYSQLYFPMLPWSFYICSRASISKGSFYYLSISFYNILFFCPCIQHLLCDSEYINVECFNISSLGIISFLLNICFPCFFWS